MGIFNEFDPVYLRHEEKKKILLAAVHKIMEKDSLDNLQPFSFYKKSSNLFRDSFRKNKKMSIDVTGFNSVLSVDTTTMVADVEGMTSYETLVDATLAKGVLPTVVPELKTITIGGAAAGLGIESSSFRYGLVHESIVEMEILLGDGRIVICTAYNEYRDLFFAFPNTYGTLGFALRAKVNLIPVKKYVKLIHLRYEESKKYFSALETYCRHSEEEKKIAYIDGTIFGPHEMYITLTEFVDDVPFVSNYRYMQMYFCSISEKTEDYLTTLDYIWRWDADWFWCSDVFGMQNRWLRFLFGKWMLHSGIYAKLMHFLHRHRNLERLLIGSRGKQESVIQDVLIPIGEADKFLAFLQKDILIKPIWICPMQLTAMGQLYSFCPLGRDTLYMDFGFWGSVESVYPPGHFNRMIEKKAVELGGLKSLYSSSFYSEDEFWSIYNAELYKSLKAKYDPNQRLSSLYAKCCSSHSPYHELIK